MAHLKQNQVSLSQSSNSLVFSFFPNHCKSVRISSQQGGDSCFARGKDCLAGDRLPRKTLPRTDLKFPSQGKKKQSIPKESLLSNIFFEILFILLLQLKSFSFQEFSYNEIHNRRVALGITCVQCTPVQLEILRRAGAMPISSRSTILFFIGVNQTGDS